MEESTHQLNADNSRHVSTDGETNLDTSRYVLTVEEAAQLFADGGVPRHSRTISRLCQLRELDCMRVKTEKNYRYLVDRNSVEKYIVDLQQALHFASKTHPDMSSHVQTDDMTSHDMSRHDETRYETSPQPERDTELQQRVEELEGELMHVRIEKAAKDHVINLMTAERRDFISQMNDMSFRLGEAHTKLQMLDAPGQDVQASHIETRDETTPRAADVVKDEPTPADEPQPPRRGFFGRLLG